MSIKTTEHQIGSASSVDFEPEKLDLEEKQSMNTVYLRLEH
jgi:hypothetical protein